MLGVAILDFNDAKPQLHVIDTAQWDARMEVLRARLSGSVLDLVKDIFPAARIQSNEARIGSTDGERGESLSISLAGDTAGLWTDHATGEGGDLIDLWRQTQSYADFPKAVQELEEWLGIGSTMPRFNTKIHKVAAERKAKADREPKTDTSLGPPTHSWYFYSAEGAILGIERRYELATGDKTYRLFNASSEARAPDQRPLYRQPEIRTADTVVFVEGAKCAEALASIGIEATAAMGGANALLEKVDWTPLAGKTVILWPDNDPITDTPKSQVGQRFMERVRPILEGIGCSVTTVKIPDNAPADGWDAADAIAEGRDIAALLATNSANTPSFKFNVTFYADIPDEHHKTWLVRDIFGSNEFTVVYGAPGCGKSVLIGDGAAHVAAGLPWFDKATRKCAVIYVAAERHALVKRRLAAWRKHHQIKNLPLTVLDGLFNLATDPTHADEIIRIASFVAERTGYPVGWIIIDTKAQVMGGGDENASKDISVLNNNIAKLMTTGAHVTVIDHTPQNDPKRMKGNGGLAGAADGSFLVQKEAKARTLTIGSKSPNDGPDDIALAFHLHSVTLGVNQEAEETKAPVVLPVEYDEGSLNPDQPVERKSAQRLGSRQKTILTAIEKAAREGQKLEFMRLQLMTKLDKGNLGSSLRAMVDQGVLVSGGTGDKRWWTLA